MKTITSTRSKSVLMAGAVALAFSLGGCQSLTLNALSGYTIQASPNLPPAALPTYRTGDKYYYSNGSREEVVNLDAEKVYLLSRSDRRIANAHDFTVPQPYLESSTKEYFKTTDTPPKTLWPLRVGKTATYLTNGRSVEKASGKVTEYQQKWACEVEPGVHLRVRSGTFDAYPIVCKRYSTSSGLWRQKRTWFYAPKLQTYVLRHDLYKSGTEYVRELTAVRPSLDDVSASARKGIIHAWQVALESRKSGESETWTSRKGTVRVRVTPLATYRAANGQYCRTYQQELTRQGATRMYMGVACRHGKHKWRTPSRA